MTLGRLKLALAKLPPDMHDMEVVLLYPENGKSQCDLLSFVGYIPTDGYQSIALGTYSEVQRKVENGEMEPPEGYIPPINNDSFAE